MIKRCYPNIVGKYNHIHVYTVYIVYINLTTTNIQNRQTDRHTQIETGRVLLSIGVCLPCNLLYGRMAERSKVNQYHYYYSSSVTYTLVPLYTL